MPTSKVLLDLHDWAATRLARRVLWLARTVRPKTRVDHAHYADGLEFRERTWDWAPGQRESWMLERLREVVRSAYATTRYYREILDSSGFDPRSDFTFSDFRHFPVLERADVQNRLEDLLSTDVPAAQRRWNATGGSSGQPVELYLGPRERGWRASGSDFSMRRLGVEPGVRRALLWGHHLDPVQRTSLLDQLQDYAGNRAWFDCLRLSDEILRSYEQRMSKYQPRCLVAYASALAAFAEAIERAGRAPATFPSRRIVTGAEKLLKEQREIAERVFRVPIHERYGSRDVGDMGFQYEPWKSLSYRIDWALVLVEPAGDGPESDILVTKLQADAMPMIRYRTDDVGVFPDAARPGFPVFELHEVLGRRADRVFKRDGGWVHGIHFPHLLKEFRPRDFQVHQREDYSVDVAVVLASSDSDASTLTAIQRNLEANLPSIEVRVRSVDSIPRTKANKWRPVISDVRREQHD